MGEDQAMKRSRFSEEQIIGVLKEHEAGTKTADLCRKHGISEATFYTGRAGSAGWMFGRLGGCGRWRARMPS